MQAAVIELRDRGEAESAERLSMALDSGKMRKVTLGEALVRLDRRLPMSKSNVSVVFVNTRLPTHRMYSYTEVDTVMQNDPSVVQLAGQDTRRWFSAVPDVFEQYSMR